MPFEVVRLIRDARYVDALHQVRALCVAAGGLPDDALTSVLASAYAGHGFQVLALQVQTCVRMVDDNRWMFRLGARVHNLSVDLGVHGRDPQTPPSHPNVASGHR